MVPLKILDAPKFYNCQFLAPSSQILAKTLLLVTIPEGENQNTFLASSSGKKKLIDFITKFQTKTFMCHAECVFSKNLDVQVPP